MLTGSLRREASLERLGRAVKASLIVLAALFMVSASTAAQQTRSGLTQRPTRLEMMSRQSSVDPASSPRLGGSVEPASRRRYVFVGALVGAIAGAYIGHEIVGAPQSCPATPGSSCGHNRTLATVGFGVSGAVIGGLTGALVSRWR